VDEADEEVPPGGEELPDPPWQAWHPDEAARRLAGVEAPWCVAAGWALDLFRGGQVREHEDLEVAIPAGRFALIAAALAGFEFHVVGSGRRWPLDSPAFKIMHQTWVYEPDADRYRLDVFREPHDGDTWICRRDAQIRRPYAEIIERTSDGIPYLAPEIVLLFKAKHGRPKDEADFAGALPLLSAARRSWLADHLAMVHPGHRWLAQLSGRPGL
jgi:Aminoglycoside-2''-adenylyltransferase